MAVGYVVPVIRTQMVNRMIPKNSLSTPIDKDPQRRSALAKVYALLIKLAEEQESQTESPEKDSSEEVSVPLQKNIPPEV